MKLVYEDGTPVVVGDLVTLHQAHPDEDGEMWTVKYITKPHKPSSTGRVGLERGEYVTEYFPSVIGAKWIEREDHECEDTDNPFDVTGHEHAMSKRPW